MFYCIFNWFFKITAWFLQWICFRTKIHYIDKSVQSRRIRGAAIIISNHTSVFDYGVYIFVFPFRTLRVLMAEVLFEKKPLNLLLKALGGIRVNRDAHSMSSMFKAEKILKKGGVVGIFPEGRLPLKTETPPLPFKIGAAYLALASGVPVIPVYTNGSYFNPKKRAHVIIGTPIDPADFNGKNSRKNIEALNTAMRESIIALEKELHERIGKG